MIFRLLGQWPYEALVDFMVINLFDTYGLVVSSGYKTGLILFLFPDEIKSE
ncbi:Imm45 family immunity protein [Pragia fontium]|uniref:Imm45 family immunity protein n=1 Tax=Pragia fontium TaxID=82985 RepID=UPI00215D9372|nr:Imm45 family immunity protein [Pragia fontium]